MTPKQEEALRDYLQEVIVPLIEEVLVKKLGQAMTFAKKELAEQPAQQEPVQRYSPDGEGGMEIDSLGAWVKFASPPAQRTWVGLSDAQSTVIWANSQSVDEAIRATEKQLMENNI